jgi:hypothetical protein
VRHASFSEWSRFLDCRASWHAEYVLSRPRGPSHPSRRLGSLFEACFAAKLRAWAASLGAPLGLQKYRTGGVGETSGREVVEGPPETDPRAALRRKCAEETWAWTEEHGSTEEAGLLALALADRAFDLFGFSQGRFKPAIVRGVFSVQQRLTCDLPLDPEGDAAGYYAGLSGIPDVVVLDGERDWRPVLGDTKVRAGLSDVDLGADPQLNLYQHLLARNGLRVVACEQWGILAKLPVEPPITKSKKLVSRDAEHPTTPELYEAACRRNGEKPDPAHAEKLALRRWHLASPGGGTDAEVGRTVAELCADLELMAALALRPDAEWRGGVAPVTRNNRTFAGSPCHRCDVRGECHETKSRGLPLAAAFAEKTPTRQAASLEELDAQEPA